MFVYGIGMSALLRRIDLTTKLVAPVLTGQIITYGSLIIGALFISIWNLISMVFEYNLLLKLYTSFPELALKNTDGEWYYCRRVTRNFMCHDLVG